MADLSGQFKVDGLVKQREELEHLLTSDPLMEKRIQALIRKVLGHARANLRKEAASGLRMDSDPRMAYKAVRFAVYKRLLGGQVNILQSFRTSSGGFYYEPPRHPSVRGGNRRPQSMRTKKLMSYEGPDRGFILRFLNQGTKSRNIEHLVGIKRFDGTHKFRWSNDNGRYGNRGSIKARHWFGNASLRELQAVAGEMTTLIDDLIKQEIK